LWQRLKWHDLIGFQLKVKPVKNGNIYSEYQAGSFPEITIKHIRLYPKN